MYKPIYLLKIWMCSKYREFLFDLLYVLEFSYELSDTIKYDIV